MLLRAGLVVVAGVLLGLLAHGGQPTHAQSIRTWTGAGGNQLFSNPANWSGNVWPVDGDSLHFTGTGGNVIVNNDFPGLRLSRMEFDGTGNFTVYGMGITLDQGIYVDGSANVRFDNALFGAGGGIVGPQGKLSLYADNAFTGMLETFGELHVHAPGALGSLAGITRVQGGGTLFIPISMPILDEPIHLQGKGSGLRAHALIALGEPVVLGNVHVALETSILGEDLLISNGIKESFPDFDLTIEGEVEVRGTTTVEGPIRVTSNGQLTWNTTAQVDIYLAPSALLLGSGTVRSITSERGGIIPINGTETARLTATGAVDLAVAGGALVLVLNGTTAATDYSQLRAGGPITIRDEAGVAVTLAMNYEPEVGQEYVILDNTGAEPINGTFAALPEGGVLEIDEGFFGKITYVGGDGNDVVVEIVEEDQTPPDPRPYKQVIPMVARDG